jgi:hypothetical protein
MNKRVKRFLITAVVVMAVSAALLAIVEWDRRQQAAAAAQQVMDGSGRVLSAEELVQKYRQPAELAKLVDRVRERFAIMHERTVRSRHTRTTRLTESDRRGEAVHVREMVERVWFDGMQENTQLIEQRVLLGDGAGLVPGKSKLPNPAENPHRPFPTDAAQDVYDYRFERIEEIDGQPAGRIRFEPWLTDSLVSRGSAWVLLDSGEPVRLRVSPLKPPPFVDHLDVLIDYGRAENGHNQTRRVTLDGSGGFAFLARRLHVECTMGDYHERDQ